MVTPKQFHHILTISKCWSTKRDERYTQTDTYNDNEVLLNVANVLMGMGMGIPKALAIILSDARSVLLCI